MTALLIDRHKSYIKINVRGFEYSVCSHNESANLSLVTSGKSKREQTVNVGRGNRVILSNMFLRLECLERQTMSRQAKITKKKIKNEQSLVQA